MMMGQRSWVRAGVSLGANLVRGGFSFVTAIVVARSLGAPRYGDYTFLLGSFAALTLLLDCGTTAAFYTMLAARRRQRRFFVVYASWTVGVQFLLTLLTIAFLLPPGAVHAIWLGFDRSIVLISLASSFVATQIWTAVTQMAEAVRRTVFIQIASTIQVVLHLIIIGAAIHIGALSLRLLLVLPIIELLLFTVVLLPSLLRVNLRTADAASPEPWGAVIAEYWKYCRPLVAYSAVGFAFQFADRWFLQHFGGPTQQGYFSIGLQFANIANVATVSILAVIWKEVAESFGKNDLVRVRSMFLRARAAVFFCGAAVSAMFLPYVGLILRTTAGTQFAAATLCVSLLFLYPIHQAVSQLQQTFLLATGATSAYSVIGIVGMLMSIPISYAVLAPPAARIPGLGLGALGLAMKFVVMQLIGVTAQFWYLRRQHAFPWPIRYDIAVLAALFAASWVTKFAVDALFRAAGLERMAVTTAAIGAISYAAGASFVLVRWPSLAGFTTQQRDAAIRAIEGVFVHVGKSVKLRDET